LVTSACDPRALRRDLVRGSVLARFLKRVDSSVAFDLRKHIGLYHTEPLSVSEAVALCHESGALWGVRFRLQPFHARCEVGDD
jgi:hypothetical protein